MKKNYIKPEMTTEPFCYKETLLLDASPYESDATALSRERRSTPFGDENTVEVLVPYNTSDNQWEGAGTGKSGLW